MPTVPQITILTAKSYFSYEMEYQQAYMEKMRLKVLLMALSLFMTNSIILTIIIIIIEHVLDMRREMVHFQHKWNNKTQKTN